MDKKKYIHIVYNAWHAAGGEDAIRNGMRRLGYTPHFWRDPMATLVEIADGDDDERESFAADMVLIRDYALNNKGN